MKKVFALLLALWAAIPCWAEDPAYTDIDAEAYIYNRGITDRTEIERIHVWYRGLKNLQLYTNVTYMASLRSQHGAVSNSTTIFPMSGGVITLVGGVTQGTNGLVYTNSTSDYAWFANPLGTNLSAYTIVAAFAAEYTGAGAGVIGSYQHTANLKGPQLFVHGNVNAGVNAHAIYNYGSSDGSTSHSGGFYAGRYVSGAGQFVALTYSSTAYKTYTGTEQVQTQSTNTSQVWNMNTNWFLGRLQENIRPMKGTIAFCATFNKNLTEYEVGAVRRLYAKTIGKGYVPEATIVWEGDSVTSASNTEFVYSKHLYTNSVWQPRVQGRMIAVSGSTISDALSRFTNYAKPMLIEKDYSRLYYSMYIGYNDIGGGTSAQTTYLAYTSLASLAREAGFKVIAWTMQPSATISGAKETERQIFNRMLRENRGQYDILVDAANQFPFREAGVTANTDYYQVDGDHLTSLGEKQLSEAVYNALNEP